MDTPQNAFAHLPAGTKFFDISRYQLAQILGIDRQPAEADLPKFVAAMQAAKDAGMGLVAMRATEGRWVAQGQMYVDPAFAFFSRAAKQVGLPRIAYHRFVPSQDTVRNAVTQARHFLQVAYYDNNLDQPEGPAMLDWENIPGEPKLHPFDAIAWLEIIRQATSLPPLLYSSGHYLDEETIPVTLLGLHQEWALDYDLYDASYPYVLTAGSKPSLPHAFQAAGKQPIAWQNVGGGPVLDADGNKTVWVNVDLDVKL